MQVEIAVGTAILVVLLGALMVSVRRRRRTADTIGRYANAVSALRTIASNSKPVAARISTVEPVSDGDSDADMEVDMEMASVHMLHEFASTAPSRRSLRSAGRVRRNIDPDTVAKRPVIAQLPSVSAPRNGRPGSSQTG